MKNQRNRKNEIIDEVTGQVYENTDDYPVYVPLFRSPYINRPPREILQFDPREKRTKDEFKDECDTNKIWANYVKTGRLDQLQKAKGFYADLSTGPQTFHESLNLVTSTREMFAQLPADIRNAFGNDVQKFMAEAAHNPEGLFEVLKPLQPIDGSAPTPVAPPKPEPAPASPEPEKTPSTNPVS